MNLAEIRENRVKMIMKFSIPCIVGMILTSLITIVDGYFIGNYVGKAGTVAVNIGLPLLYVYVGLGIMIGVGGIALAGIAFGANERKRCNGIFNQTMALTAIVTVALTAVVAIAFYPITGILGLDANTLECFREYYFVMIFTYPVMIVNTGFGMFMRGEGRPELTMFLNILGIVLNTVLDYVAVRVFYMGMRGVALASLLSVCVVCVLSVLYFKNKSKVYRFARFTFVKEDVKMIFFNGSSELIGELSMSITMFAYNTIIMKEAGTNGVAAFAIVGYLAYIFNMFILGIGQGMSPLVSFAYGAKDKETSKKLCHSCIWYSTIVGVVAFLGSILLRREYSQLFIQEKTVAGIVQSGILLFGSSFILQGTNVISSFFFTSIGKAKESAIISAMRGLVVLLVLVLVLPYFFGMTGVWLVAPITELITMGVAVKFLLDRKLLQV